MLRSVRFAVVLGALQLHLQPLHADLEAVHGLDGCLCRHGIVVADEACGRHRREKLVNKKGKDRCDKWSFFQLGIELETF